jgi:transposase
MIDVAASKFCDLVPIERYASIAGREGLEDLPPQSLIELTHNLAEFVEPAVERILEVEIKPSEVLHADETPHRMLEGSAKSNWFLWGFSTPSASFFEIHDTRSGDVASDILKNSKALYLMSDVFSGYGKAVKDTNQFRREQNLEPIKNIYCNAHARRKFKEARDRFKEGQVYLDLFKKIYFLESLGKGKPPDELLSLRLKMRPYFEEIRARAMEDLNNYSSKSSMAKACAYFLKNYTGFTLFLENPKLPIDNNPQERLLRNPVIGRKTWHGTHSERGAKTTAIMFTLIESCKLNHINPREYLKNLVFELLQGKPAFTPSEFKHLKDLAHQSTG